ncbi:hypothetical protein EBB07_29340 [Paenibacillaceae bacterium]|nr:hypothetical protein EBB07_29340 [Paenibacillaceae bacterium]
MKIEINNNRTMEFVHDETTQKVNVITDETTAIPEGDMVMLVNYYRYMKENDVQCDFINPNGKY